MVTGHSVWGIGAHMGELNRLGEALPPAFFNLDCALPDHDTLGLVPDEVLGFELGAHAVESPRTPLGDPDFDDVPSHHELAVDSLVLDRHEVGLDLLFHYNIGCNIGKHDPYLAANMLLLGLRKIEAHDYSPLIKSLLDTNENKPSLIVQKAADGLLESLLVPESEGIVEHLVLIEVRLGLGQILPKHELLQTAHPGFLVFESHQGLVFVAGHHHELGIEDLDGSHVKAGLPGLAWWRLLLLPGGFEVRVLFGFLL